VLASARHDRDLLTYKFDATGTLLSRAALRLPSELPAHRSLHDFTLHPAPDGGAWLDWNRSSQSRPAFRLASDGRLLAQTTIGGNLSQLLPAPDEGWYVVRLDGLERISASGQFGWRIPRSSVDARFRRLLTRADGGFWIAVNRTGATRSKLELHRYAADRSLQGVTTLPCEGCADATVTQMSAHPDGGAILAGTGPAFVARLRADGTFAWLVRSSATTISDLHVGQTGDIVVRENQNGQFVGLSPADGSERWRIWANLAVPAGAGALSVIESSADPGHKYVVRRTDVDGAVLWQRGFGGPHLSRVAEARYDSGGTIELLGSQLSAPFEVCAATPRLIRIDAEGTESVSASVCSVPLNAQTWDLQLSARNRLLIHTGYGIESRDERGRVRWRYQSCQGCPAPHYGRFGYTIGAFVATDDGGAWTLEYFRPGENWDARQDRLVRIDPNGDPGTVIDLTPPAGVARPLYRLTAGPRNEAYLLRTHSRTPSLGLEWRRISSDGSSTGHSIALESSDHHAAIQDLSLLPDGDLLAILDPTAELTCGPAQWCPYGNPSVLRISSRGELLWRSPVEVGSEHLAFHRSGSTLLFSSGENYPHEYQWVDAAGTVRARAELATLGPSDWLYSAHLDASHRGVVVSRLGLQRLDLTLGVAQHSRLFPQGAWLASSQWSPLGLLLDWETNPQGTAAWLVDEETLATRLRASVELPPDQAGASGGSTAVRASAEGAVVMLHTENHEGGLIARYAALFALPGSAIEHRIFRDGIEP
jgi:hypothetical protein